MHPEARPAGAPAGAKTRRFAPPDPEHALRLVAKYDRPGPRYTSYPTAPVWTEAFDAEAFRTALAAAAGGPLTVYVHVPYCERLCTYCACNRIITRDHTLAGPYLDALEREADRLAGALGGGAPCAQLALGGGTPTWLATAELERLLRAVDARFPPRSDAERSAELDPRVTTDDHLALLAERGFGRVSLGVQDLSPRVQEAVRRRQTLEQTAATTERARGLGIRSVNFDLIYGLPFQSVASFAETLREVIALRPDRIALYAYAHVTWVSKQQRGFEKSDLPGPTERLAIFALAIRTLTEAGYLFVGLDHFARPEDELARAAEDGTLQRNFMGYTTRRGAGLLGLGPSAISELEDAYAQSVRTPEEWQQRLTAGELATLRGWRLDEDDRRRKWLIQELMCRGEIDPAGYAEHFGEALRARIPDLDARLADFVADGLLEPGDGAWRVTPLGRLFLRPLAMAFDAHLAPPAAGRPVFSRTV